MIAVLHVWLFGSRQHMGLVACQGRWARYAGCVSGDLHSWSKEVMTFVHLIFFYSWTFTCGGAVANVRKQFCYGFFGKMVAKINLYIFPLFLENSGIFFRPFTPAPSYLYDIKAINSFIIFISFL